MPSEGSDGIGVGESAAVATEPSFPRKWESRTRGLGNRFIR
ncbi:TPA: hypothetical protein ACK4VF_001766 [Neisseria gonorrhoeae]|nr:hypothetical protein [Neisseria gonorrhoeae]